MKLLTETEGLRDRLAAAQAKERAARAEAGRIRREMEAADRRLETQRLCTLGRAWLALGERSPSFREMGGRFLGSYISRPADRAALHGTPWAVPEPDVQPGENGEASARSGDGGEHEHA